LSNRRAFYDTSHVLPAAMLETYVEKWPTPRIENFLYVLRSGMMGWLTIMLDTTAWTPEQRKAAKMAFAVYKTGLRPLIRDTDLYHVSDRPDGIPWDGLEYFDAAKGRGVLYAFRGSTQTESTHTFVLKGFEAGPLLPAPLSGPLCAGSKGFWKGLAVPRSRRRTRLASEFRIDFLRGSELEAGLNRDSPKV